MCLRLYESPSAICRLGWEVEEIRRDDVNKLNDYTIKIELIINDTLIIGE